MTEKTAAPARDTAQSADIIIIGAGIAGASVAAELGELDNSARILLLETESQPGYHATGRSAALLVLNYGPPAICALTHASRGFFGTPPDGFADSPLISPRPMMTVARADQLGQLEKFHADLHPDSDATWLTGGAIKQAQPLLRDDYAVAAILEHGGQDIDVAALHQGYLRAFKNHGGSLITNAAVTALHHSGTTWQIDTRQGRFTAPIVVNAAGAWADDIAAMAGVAKTGLTPKRRTAVIIAAPDGINTADLPATDGVGEEFYLKPDAGRLLISPADQTPSAPCDAQPDEMDVAICVDRIMTAFDLNVRRIENKWAGLRSFAPDGSPVVGYDTQSDGFFWLAGQGGYGIQTAPALSRVAAALILDKPVPSDIRGHGLDLATLAPSRCATP